MDHFILDTNLNNCTLYAVDNTVGQLDPDTYREERATAQNPEGERRASYAIVTVEGKAVRVTAHGEDPTRTPALGHLVDAGQSIVLMDFDCIKKFRFTAAVADETPRLMVSIGGFRLS